MAIPLFNTKYSTLGLMTIVLLLALALVVGHHAFYYTLTGQPVLNTTPFLSLTSSLRLSDKQFYLSVGALFGYHVKLVLGVSVSTVFVFDQFTWKSIQGRTTQIRVIDNLFSVLKKRICGI